jgi:hypothetical protein
MQPANTERKTPHATSNPHPAKSLYAIVKTPQFCICHLVSGAVELATARIIYRVKLGRTCGIFRSCGKNAAPDVLACGGRRTHAADIACKNRILAMILAMMDRL